MNALQLGYQTGRREVAYAATEACLMFTRSRGAVLPYVTLLLRLSVQHLLTGTIFVARQEPAQEGSPGMSVEGQTEKNST